MILEGALDQLDGALTGVRMGVRPDSLLATAAADCLGMVQAYRSDAAAFAENGDRVNTVAAIAYAAGWLDAAVAIGLLDGASSGLGLINGAVPDSDAGRLEEKARRYAAMLGTAVECAGPAPDPASPAYGAAQGVLSVARALLPPATSLLARGDLEGSLSVCSYAYGWLDAGVRAGLVAIVGDRSLFAV